MKNLRFKAHRDLIKDKSVNKASFQALVKGKGRGMTYSEIFIDQTK